MSIEKVLIVFRVIVLLASFRIAQNCIRHAIDCIFERAEYLPSNIDFDSFTALYRVVELGL